MRRRTRLSLLSPYLHCVCCELELAQAWGLVQCFLSLVSLSAQPQGLPARSSNSLAQATCCQYTHASSSQLQTWRFPDMPPSLYMHGLLLYAATGARYTSQSAATYNIKHTQQRSGTVVWRHGSQTLTAHSPAAALQT